MEACFKSVLKCLPSIIDCYQVKEEKKEEVEEEKDADSGTIPPLRARRKLMIAEWPKITQTILTGILEGSLAYEKHSMKQVSLVTANFTNIMAIVMEVPTFCQSFRFMGRMLPLLWLLIRLWAGTSLRFLH